MKYPRTISTAVVVLFFGTFAVYAQREPEKQPEKQQSKPEQTARPSAQQQRPQAQPKPAQHAQAQQKQPAQQPKQQAHEAKPQQPRQQQAHEAKPQQPRQQQAHEAKPQQPKQQQAHEAKPQQPTQQQAHQTGQPPQGHPTKPQAVAWQQQKGWLKTGGGWQGRGTWAQNGDRNWNSDHRTWAQRGGYGGYYIPQNTYNLSFGSQHWFRMGGLPSMYMGYPRFSYDGFWFMLVDPWPGTWAENWYADDDVYIDYDNGYYLCNRSYPGIRIAIIVSV